MEPPAPRSFLDLPDAIRRRIYCEAGLFADTNVYVFRLWSLLCATHGMMPHNLEFSLNLLLTSRAVHKEVSHIFFSTNRFIVKDALALLRLPVSALPSISRLSVQLNFVDDDRQCRYGHNPDPPEFPSQDEWCLSKDDSVLKDWEDAAKYIAPYIKPRALDFDLLCDVDSPETARLALHPLRHLPILASCKIRLYYGPGKPELEAIAREAVLRSIEPPKFPQEGFPFQRLPPELREMILRYTDLVTPYNTVHYTVIGDSRKRTYLVQFQSCREMCHKPHDKCHPNEHRRCNSVRRCVNPCPHRMCGNCTHYGCQFVMGCQIRTNRRIGTQCRCPTGCFCGRRHTAYSVDCRCWRSPTPLFLVSKAFYAEAQAVFFSTNKFNVCDGQLYKDNHPEVVFLGKILSDTALCNLRSLFLTLHNGVYDKWMETLRRVDGKLTNLQYLSIHISDMDHPGWPGPDFADELQGQSEETTIRTVKQLMSTLWPIKNIDSAGSAMKYFYVGILQHSNLFQYYKQREEIPPFKPWKRGYTSKLVFKRKVYGNSAGDVEDTSSALRSRDDVWIEGVLVGGYSFRNYFMSLIRG
ncbi:hypothetical protein F4811DRAFT_570091 [Daldinia bambusicola]|nr:hypothetical protein F4811DRAFT_570091 [Daldinia bambusicola]